LNPNSWNGGGMGNNVLSWIKVDRFANNFWNNCMFKLASRSSGSSTVVEHVPHYLKVEGLSLAKNVIFGSKINI
jgi:hypothetical protein